MHFKCRKYHGALFSCLLAFVLNTAWAQADEPSAVPYRPSVSTPAALSQPGWLELEAGGLRTGAGGNVRRDSLPYTLKLALTPDWGIRWSGEAWVAQTDDGGQRINGGGDSAIVLKRRFAVDDKSAFGLELGTTLPTGTGAISSGQSDYSITGIYSADVGNYHTDINLGMTRFGQEDPILGHTQQLWAASLSTALNERWGIVGEFSGNQRDGANATSQFLFAASYNASNALVLDAGFSRSTRNDVPDWSILTGLTMLVGKLF